MRVGQLPLETRINISIFLGLIFNISLFPGLHEEFPLEGAQANAHRREALQLLVARVRLEICEIGRADEASEETHGKQTFQMSPL